MSTIQELARTAYDALETKTRDNGDSFICIRDGSPKWIQEMIHTAHADMWPDDYKYEFSRDALHGQQQTRTHDIAYIRQLLLVNMAGQPLQRIAGHGIVTQLREAGRGGSETAWPEVRRHGHEWVRTSSRPESRS